MICTSPVPNNLKLFVESHLQLLQSLGTVQFLSFHPFPAIKTAPISLSDHYFTDSVPKFRLEGLPCIFYSLACLETRLKKISCKVAAKPARAKRTQCVLCLCYTYSGRFG